MNLVRAVENRFRNLDNDIKEMEDEDKKCLSGVIACEEEKDMSKMEEGMYRRRTLRLSRCFIYHRQRETHTGNRGSNYFQACIFRTIKKKKNVQKKNQNAIFTMWRMSFNG